MFNYIMHQNRKVILRYNVDLLWENFEIMIFSRKEDYYADWNA